MKKINVITIDGPSASGKGALARGIANKFDFNILDSASSTFKAFGSNSLKQLSFIFLN